MKKICLFIVVAFFQIVFAQMAVAQNMAVENAHWIVGLWNSNNPPWAETDYYQYFVHGDSSLFDEQYKKVYFRQMQDSQPYLIENELLCGLIRDDTLSQKTYVVNFCFPHLWECQINQDILLYDFGKMIGDTMNICFGASSIIQSINYEFIYGEERKILNSDWNDRYIQGIGSDYGVFEWGMGSKGWWFNLFSYCVGTDLECGCQWVGIDDNDVDKSVNFKVFPNPIDGNVIYLISRNYYLEPVEIKVLDMLGRSVYDNVFSTLSDELLIDLSGIKSPSMLVILVKINKKIVHKQKIIKL